MNAKVISLLNEKGGVAKTTTATAIAYILAKRGKKVCLIDFDGQNHSTLLCGVQNANTLPVTIATLLNKVIMDEPLPAPESYIINNNGVDLIPSNSQLFTLERNLCNVDFRERILKTYVDTIRERYEYIIIDTMPQIGTPMMNVLLCADSIVIPTQAELLSAVGMTELVRHATLRRASPRAVPRRVGQHCQEKQRSQPQNRGAAHHHVRQADKAVGRYSRNARNLLPEPSPHF